MKGKLARPEQCEKCNRHCKPDAHHKDYTRPQDVQWLCRSCHVMEHYTTNCLSCGKPTSGRNNLCRKHNIRLRLYGDPNYKRQAKLCKCGQKSRLRGRCMRCAYREDIVHREKQKAAIKKSKEKRRARLLESKRHIAMGDFD